MITFKQFLTEAVHWESMKSRYSSTDDLHRIDLSNKSGAVGYIEWDRDDGVVSNIFVGKSYRREGVGTYLWELATDWAEENDANPPEHSTARTKDGDAFAHAIGGHVPDLKDDVDGWSS